MNTFRKSNRKGRKLETFVAEAFVAIFQNKTIRPTKNSGASGELGDISNSYFVCECKQRYTKDITIRKDTWDKLCSEIPLNSKKLPLLVLENKNKDKFAVLNFEDFTKILQLLYSEGLI